MTSPNYRTPDVWNNLLLGGGCVRFDQLSETGNSVVPHIYTNSAHVNVGIQRVYIDWSEPAPRALNFDTESDDGAIVTMGVWPDETMTGMGITCGPSGGSPLTKLFLYKNGVRITASSTQLYHPYANLWCWWLWAPAGESPVKVAYDALAARVQALEDWKNSLPS